MSQFHVSQIETHLRERYKESHWRDTLSEVANLSRILAMHAVNFVLRPSSGEESRIVEITDGGSDRGIDGVGVDTEAKLVVFVQSKWRQDGTGSMGLADILKFLEGVRSMLGMRSVNDPAHAAESTRKAVHELLKTPGGRIRLVTSTTASEPLGEEVYAPIRELLSQLNDLEGTEPIAAHVHLAQADFFNAIAEPIRPRVDINISLQDWGRASEPHRIFYGRVNAGEVAAWFNQYGVDLFAENIRVVIPRSDINEGILSTIRVEPEQFGYYNNGITILADSIESALVGLVNREVGYFRLTNASIVNGAQTVSTLGSAVGTEFEANLGRAFVMVRCIEVATDDLELGHRITRFANTQNEVSSQDFAFLDTQQHRLVRELRVLGYEYLLRSAEAPRTSDLSKVIDVRLAAIGLACANANTSFCVTAKREVSRLFGDSSLYRALFNPSTEALRVVRSALVVRNIDALLDQVESTTSGVEAGVAVHGRRIIAHLILRSLGDTFLSSPKSDMVTLIDKIEVMVRHYLSQLVKQFPDNAYPGNVFKNQARCNELLSALHNEK